MARVKVIKLGEDRELFSFFKTNPHYNVGEFLMGSSDVESGWEHNMYIIRTITHFLPDNNGDFLLLLHVEEFNPVTVKKDFEEVMGKLTKKIRAKIDEQ